jgi:hypothetical protein
MGKREGTDIHDRGTLGTSTFDYVGSVTRRCQSLGQVRCTYLAGWLSLL